MDKTNANGIAVPPRIQPAGEDGARGPESTQHPLDEDETGDANDFLSSAGTSATASEERTSGGSGSQEIRVERRTDPLFHGTDAPARTRRDEESGVSSSTATGGLDRGYGATETGHDQEGARSRGKRDWPLPQANPDRNDESEPLMKMRLKMSMGSLEGSAGSVLKDEKAANDANDYLAMGVFARAFPERFFALIVTLLVEIPTLFIISGGSDKLCMLIGRRRYQLLIAFLPLTSAISGNVGLQSSTLTTRAVSHLHVTRSCFWRWLGMEVGAACCLGISMGAALGLFAYHTSGSDPALGVTIFVAQFVSILTAGLTGTMAPLIFTFVFRRDSGQWGGPLETAIQDIIGSFAMIVLSYHTLTMFGTSEIDPGDRCGG